MQRARQLSACLLSAVLFAAASVAQEPPVSDTTPPTLDAANSGFAPGAIDVTAGPETVTVTLRVTDDLSGVTFTPPVAFPQPVMTFRSPGGVQVRQIEGYQFNLVSGDPLDGVWETQIVFPQYIENGTWTVESLVLADAVGNQAWLDGAALESLGFDTTLEVTSNADLDPPELVSFDIEPLTVDTSATGANAEVTMTLNDAVSGVDFSALGPSEWALGVLSPDERFIRICSTPTLESGDAQSGVWTSLCFFPQFSQQGNWPIWRLLLSDRAGNRAQFTPTDLADRGFPSGVAVTSDPSDTAVPQIAGFDFLPKFIDTTLGDATVTGTLQATDDISGFSGLQATFRSPSGGQTRQLFIWQPVSGDRLNGTFEGTMLFPRYSEAGTWRLQSVFYYDIVFNYASLSADQAAALGFPTVLNVVLPSEESDGQIGPDGGRVEDEVFGERASITLPPGAVGTTTEVAIDVLESELDFDMPQGFAAPGTRFVNIKFDPVPTMPFPPPGATVVLPLVNPMPAGSALTLFRVNPVSGDLEPAVSVLGGPVTGTVDAGGLSATFAGVGQFSVVVALIADNEPPQVTPPANVTVVATEAGGATAAAAPALAAFLAGGSATDNLDPAPARLAPQLGGVDVTSATLFPLGVSTVSFRYQDTAQNVGSATATVTVTTGLPKLAASVTGKSTPAPGQRLVTVKLRNTGTGHARSVTVNAIRLRTLSGSGTVTLAAPATPIAVGGIDAGGSADLQLTLNVPATVTRFSITESGTLKDVAGKSYSFSSSQSVIP